MWYTFGCVWVCMCVCIKNHNVALFGQVNVLYLGGPHTDAHALTRTRTRTHRRWAGVINDLTLTHARTHTYAGTCRLASECGAPKSMLQFSVAGTKYAAHYFYSPTHAHTHTHTYRLAHTRAFINYVWASLYALLLRHSGAWAERGGCVAGGVLGRASRRRIKNQFANFARTYWGWSASAGCSACVGVRVCGWSTHNHVCVCVRVTFLCVPRCVCNSF